MANSPDFIPDSKFSPDPHIGPDAHAPDFIPEGDFQDDEEKYGGLSGEAKALGLGALSGATLGGSNYVLTHTGLLKKEDLKGYQETNPIASTVGEVGGGVGSAILAPEASLVGLIGKGGRAVQGGVKALKLARLAEEGSAAAKVLGAAGEIGAAAAGSAVEGALYSGIGSTINEYSVGDPALNGEKLIDVFGHNFGEGALYGGALGGVLKGAAIGIPESVKAAKNGLESIHDALIGKGRGEAGLLSQVSPGSKLTDMMANRMTNLDIDQQTELLNKTTSDINEVLNNTQSSLKDLNQNLRPKEISALIETANPEKVSLATSDVIRELNDKLDYMKKNTGLFNSNAIAKLDNWRFQLVNNLENKDPAARFEVLKDVKQGLGNWGHGLPPDATHADTKKVMTGLSSFISDKLKDPETFGFVGSSYAAHDEMLSQMYKFIGPNGKPTPLLKGLMTNLGTTQKPRWQFDSNKLKSAFKNAEDVTGMAKLDNVNQFFEVLKGLPEHLENTYANLPNASTFSKEELNQFLANKQMSFGEAGQKYLENIKNKKGGLGLRDMLAGSIAVSHPLIGAAVEAYNIATKPLDYVGKLAEMERIVGKTTSIIGRGAKAIFDPTMKASELGRGVITKSLFSDKSEDHKNATKQIAELNNNPRMMIDQVANNTEALHRVAPQTAESMQQASIRAIQFLASKIPNPPKATPFSAEYEPSATELANFERYRELVEKPTLALTQVKHNLVTPQTIETLSAVYPQLYDHMKQMVLKAATNALEKKTQISFQTKQSVSMFLQQPLDSALTPQAIASNQTAFHTAPQPQGAMQKPKPTLGGLSKMTLSSRTGINHGSQV